jgi:hypothetical protein
MPLQLLFFIQHVFDYSESRIYSFHSSLIASFLHLNPYKLNFPVLSFCTHVWAHCHRNTALVLCPVCE